MDEDLIERLAMEAFGSGPECPFALDIMVRREEGLRRFAAAVAKRCAEVADQHSAADRRLDRLGEGSRVAGWEIAAAIRVEFGVKA